MKRTLGITLAVAFAISAVSAPAMAGNGYGKQIKDQCGASFGQLRQASPHGVTPSKGAKYFATTEVEPGVTVLDFHCPPT